MTQMMTEAELLEVAIVTERPALPGVKAVPRLRWSADATPGKPISAWVMSYEPMPPAKR